ETQSLVLRAGLGGIEGGLQLAQLIALVAQLGQDRLECLKAPVGPVDRVEVGHIPILASTAGYRPEPRPGLAQGRGWGSSLSGQRRAMFALASTKCRSSASTTSSGWRRRGAARIGTWRSADQPGSAPGTTSVMYVRKNGSSERHTFRSVPLSASSRSRPWNFASASATPWPSPTCAATCIAWQYPASSSRS